MTQKLVLNPITGKFDVIDVAEDISDEILWELTNSEVVTKNQRSVNFGKDTPVYFD
jgi:hypothetical protein